MNAQKHKKRIHRITGIPGGWLAAGLGMLVLLVFIPAAQVMGGGPPMGGSSMPNCPTPMGGSVFSPTQGRSPGFNAATGAPGYLGNTPINQSGYSNFPMASGQYSSYPYSTGTTVTPQDVNNLMNDVIPGGIGSGKVYGGNGAPIQNVTPSGDPTANVTQTMNQLVPPTPPPGNPTANVTATMNQLTATGSTTPTSQSSSDGYKPYGAFPGWNALVGTDNSGNKHVISVQGPDGTTYDVGPGQTGAQVISANSGSTPSTGPSPSPSPSPSSQGYNAGGWNPQGQDTGAANP